MARASPGSAAGCGTSPQSEPTSPPDGDWDALRSSNEGPASITAVLGHTNKLSRKAADESGEEQILAANHDVLFLVTLLNPRRLERFLAAATLPACQLVLILTKSDLCESPEDAVTNHHDQLRVPVHPVSVLAGEGLDALATYLTEGRTLAMLGLSGVGKSTLLNRMAGLNRQDVSPVCEDDDCGRHTTTRREMVTLPQGGLLIDSPGIHELQLWSERADVDAAFEDVILMAEDCPSSDCSHVTAVNSVLSLRMNYETHLKHERNAGVNNYSLRLRDRFFRVFCVFRG